MRRHLVRSGLLTTTALLALGLSGCGSSASDTATGVGGSVTSAAAAATTDTTSSAAAGTDAAATEATIIIKDFAFGDPLTVAPGTTVTVTNMDSAPHNANDKGGAFSEPLIAQGESATFVAPSEPGTYDLICTSHPQMAGQLIVSG